MNSWLRARQVLVTASQAACFLRKSKETLSPYLQLYFNNGHSIDTEHDIVDTEVSPFTKILETSAKRLAKLNKSTTKISFGNHQNVDHPYDQEDFISNMNQRLLFNSNLLSVTQNPDTIKFIDAAYGLHPFTTASECLKSKTAIIKSTTTTTTSSSTPVIHSKQSNFTWGTE